LNTNQTTLSGVWESEVYVDFTCLEKEALKVYLGLEINELKIKERIF